MTRAREKLIITGVVKDADKTLDKYRGRAEQLAADGILSFADSENIKNYLDMIMPVCLMDSDKLKGSFKVMVDDGENSEADVSEAGEMVDEIKEAGLESFYTEHGKGVFPMNANGVSFNADTFAVTGNPLADLSEDMAAEQKARVAYEHLIDLATDKSVIEPLLFLRQREVVHFNRFKELYDYYKKLGYK